MGQESLFRYAVLWHPTVEERRQGKKSRIVVPPSDFMLASSDDQVKMVAIKAIPEAEMACASQLEVVVSPF